MHVKQNKITFLFILEDEFLSEEPEAHILDSDEKLESEVLIPEYAETGEEDTEQQVENKEEATEERNVCA